MPILTYNNDSTKPLTASDCRILREECDDVFEYPEAGWYCVAGYKNGKRLVHAHCDSLEEYNRMMGRGPEPDGKDGRIYGSHGYVYGRR